MQVRPQDLQEVVKGYSDSIVDEMAVPSYTHWNPLIKWLMWKRLAVVQDLCGNLRIGVAVDYGTGTGIMLAFLSQIANRVVAFDKFIAPASRLCELQNLHNVELKDVDTLPVPLPDENVDLILCLDVLEHIQVLQETVKELVRVLKPKGRLVVSGPSENPIYKLGRLLAGFQKRATYHRWNIDDVNKALKTHLSLIQQKTLLGPVHLFDISVFQKLPNDHSSSPRD